MKIDILVVDYHENRTRETLSYWRSTSAYEVDFVLGDHTAIEVKATANASSHHLKGLKALQEENILKRFVLISCDPHPRSVSGLQILPWSNFLSRLWSGEFIP